MYEKANWKRRTEIIDYCVQVLADDTSGHQAEAGDTRTRPSLSASVTDEAKVRYDGASLQ